MMNSVNIDIVLIDIDQTVLLWFERGCDVIELCRQPNLVTLLTQPGPFQRNFQGLYSNIPTEIREVRDLEKLSGTLR